MLELFPDTATISDGELELAGITVSALAAEFGTPLVVYCERTLRANAHAYREAAPEALLVYGTKAFPSVALLVLFAAEGFGADVSTLGELAFALEARVPPERLVVHGNNKSDEELRAAKEARVGLVVLDALDEIERVAEAGIRRVLIRVTPGIEAETHEAIRTGHTGSKFGLPPDDALEALAHARLAGLDAVGLHVHLGSQLLDATAIRTTVDWLASFVARCRSDLNWTPEAVDLGGGLGIPYVEEDIAPAIGEFVTGIRDRLAQAWAFHDLPPPQLVLEPGRSLVGRAGVTLYRVGAVKRASETTTYVAIDGGLSDNPRPQLYEARHTAVIATRAEAEPTGAFTVCGKHCESGDVLIDRVALSEPRRGDLLAVPATGAYTLAMGSNYNAVPRPAAVLVADGQARLIRRRETVDDLLAAEVVP